MKAPRLILLLAVFALLLAAWWLRPRDAAPSPPAETQNSAAISKHPSKESEPSVADKSPVDMAAPDATVTRLIESTIPRFNASSGREESNAILEELREGIRNADPHHAALAISTFLKTGRDASTKLPFVVGSEGVMTTAPTLRTALLDLLGSSAPAAALELSREVMDAKGSPDEYAIALRNLAWNDLDGDLKNELSSRFNDMLEKKDWLADPSAGFLEALDAAVKLADLPTLSTLARIHSGTASDNPLARATFIALDRMVLGSPALLVQANTVDPGLASLTPTLRASLFSRLDVTDPAQRDVFSGYLAAPNHGPTETDYFTSIFPNGNFLQGHWLITSGEPGQSIESRLAADRAVLKEIESLQSTARGDSAAILARIRERLLRTMK
jgi:hypothetical protein